MSEIDANATRARIEEIKDGFAGHIDGFDLEEAIKFLLAIAEDLQNQIDELVVVQGYHPSL